LVYRLILHGLLFFNGVQEVTSLSFTASFALATAAEGFFVLKGPLAVQRIPFVRTLRCVADFPTRFFPVLFLFD